MPTSADPIESFEAFRKMVLARPALLNRFRAAPDVPTFIALVQETAAQNNFQFTAEEIHAALRASQQAWIERWI